MKKYLWMSARIFKYEIRNIFEKCALLDICVCVVYIEDSRVGTTAEGMHKETVSLGLALSHVLAVDWPNISWDSLCIAVLEHAHPRSK